MRTLIKNGTLITGTQLMRGDILLENGIIADMGESLSALPKDRILDATDCFVMPGGIDAHTHVNLHTAQGKVNDGLLAGTTAAAWGGTTTLVEHLSFPDKPCTLLEQVEEYLTHIDKQLAIDMALHAVAPANILRPNLSKELQHLIKHGVPTIKAYTAYTEMLDDIALLELMTDLRDIPNGHGLVLVHAENNAIVNMARHELRTVEPQTPSLHPRSRPKDAETEAIYRVLSLASAARVPVYIVHLSTAKGLDTIRAFQKERHTVFAETCPQYLLLDDTVYDRPDGIGFICAPPMRTPKDNEALWEGLTDGTIDVVATDHCAFTLKQKQEATQESVLNTPSGIAGIETRLPLLFTYGVLRSRITLPRFVELVSTNPAKILGLTQKGRLEIGMDADITVLDPHDERTIHAEDLHQKTDHCPFEGMIARGWPRHVTLRGHILIQDKVWVATAPHGCFVKRII